MFSGKRLSPLQHEHLKMLGNCPFTVPHQLAAGQRRELRGLGDAAYYGARQIVRCNTVLTVLGGVGGIMVV